MYTYRVAGKIEEFTHMVALLQTFGPQAQNKSQIQYSGPCDLRPPIQPAKYGLKMKVVLK